MSVSKFCHFMQKLSRKFSMNSDEFQFIYTRHLFPLQLSALVCRRLTAIGRPSVIVCSYTISESLSVGLGDILHIFNATIYYNRCVDSGLYAERGGE